MCGRYQRRADKQRIAEAFHLGNIDGLALELAPDYNTSEKNIAAHLFGSGIDERTYFIWAATGSKRPKRRQSIRNVCL